MLFQKDPRFLLAWVILASLAACDGESPAEIAAENRAAVERLEVIPPKPPNCASDPLGANLQLPSGSAIDVRIVEAGKSILYVPARWMSGYFVDNAKERFSDSIMSVTIILGKFVPDIHQVECPGVIHKFKVGERASRYWGFGLSLDGDAGAGAPLPVDGAILRIIVDPIAAESRSEPVYSTLADPAPHDAEDVDMGGWVVTDRGTYLDGRALARHDESVCQIAHGNPRTEWVASRRITPGMSIKFVFKDKAMSPHRWRSICDGIPPLYDWLTAAPKGRGAAPIPR